MKKPTKIILGILLICAVIFVYYDYTASPASVVLTEEERFVGIWDLSIDEEIEEHFDIGAYVQFNADGTGAMYIDDDESDDYEFEGWFSWEIIGTENNIRICLYPDTEYVVMSYTFSDNYNTLAFDIYGDDEIDIMHRRV